MDNFFRTQESEDAARGRQFEDLRQTRERLNLLDTEIEEVGRQLVALAEALKNPAQYSLLFDARAITIGRADLPLERPFAIINKSSLSEESIARLWTDYRSTLAKKNDLLRKLKSYLGE